MGQHRRVQPVRRQLRGRHGRARQRDAAPLRPGQGPVHRLAGEVRQVDGREAVHDRRPVGSQVDERQGVHGKGRRLQPQPRPLQHVAVEQPLPQRQARSAVKGNKVVVNFKGTPNYVQWQNAHVQHPDDQPRPGARPSPRRRSCHDVQPGQPDRHRPVHDRPERLRPDDARRLRARSAHTGGRPTQHVSPSPKPKYIIDLVNTSNTNSLNAVLGRR